MLVRLLVYGLSATVLASLVKKHSQYNLEKPVLNRIENENLKEYSKKYFELGDFVVERLEYAYRDYKDYKDNINKEK